MATQTLSVTASGTFSLVDADGVTVFSFSPSFTSDAEVTDSNHMHTGEMLTNGTSATTINSAQNNKDLIYTFVKNVDTDYIVTVQADGDDIADLKPGQCFFSPVHVDGSGDACYLPVWTDSDTIENSIACQTSTQLTVAGNVSACGGLSATQMNNYFGCYVGIGSNRPGKPLHVNDDDSVGGICVTVA